MNDDIERRLEADAARQPQVDPPPLDLAIRSIPSRSHPLVTSLAVAASVALVGGVGVAIATGGSGGHRAGAGGSEPLSSNYHVEGLLVDSSTDNPDLLTMYLDVGSCLRGKHLAVQVVSQDAQAVDLAITDTPAAGDSPASLINDLSGSSYPSSLSMSESGYQGYSSASSMPRRYADYLSSGSSDPSGGSSYPSGSSSYPSYPSGGASSVSGRYVPLNQASSGGWTSYSPSGAPTGVPTGNSDCPMTAIYAAEIDLDAAPGNRAFSVDGQPYYVLDASYGLNPEHIPAAYTPQYSEGAQNGNLVTNEAWSDDATGSFLQLEYGAPGSFPTDTAGTVTTADVNGRTATISSGSRVRAVTWTLDTGAVVEILSSAPDGDPLPAADLLAIARSLH